MYNYDKLTRIARDAILQITDFKQAQNILNNIPNSIFDNTSLTALSYYAEAIKHIMSFSDAIQKFYCNVQLERITISIYKDALSRNFSDQERRYSHDDIKKIIAVLTDIASVYYDQRELDAARDIQKTIELLKGYLENKEFPELDDSYFDLVNTYIAKGEYSNAKKRLLRAIEIRESVLGTYHQDTSPTKKRMA